MQTAAHSITVLTPAGTFTGVHVPSPSRQPKARPSFRFDRKAIMSKAWAEYRAAVRKGWVRGGFDSARFAYCLKTAWVFAQAEVKKAEALATLEARLTVTPAAPETGRIAEINAELLALEMSDGPIEKRERALRAERAALRGY